MSSTLLLSVLSLYGALAFAAPQSELPEPSPFPEPEPEPEQPTETPSHLDRTWEIVIAVVFSVLVAFVLVIAIWVRLRRRNQREQAEARRRLSSTRATSPYRRSPYTPSVKQFAKQEVVIATPYPVLPYSSKRGPSSASLSPPPTGSTEQSKC